MTSAATNEDRVLDALERVRSTGTVADDLRSPQASLLLQEIVAKGLATFDREVGRFGLTAYGRERLALRGRKSSGDVVRVEFRRPQGRR